MFTAHAGESFERGFSGLRTIGQLFLGEATPKRIGHASALDPRLRRMVARQHVHKVHSNEAYRFDDMLLDLCYLRTLFDDGVVNPGNDLASCNALISRIVNSAYGPPIEVDEWVAAFKHLHSADMVAQFAEQWRVDEPKVSDRDGRIQWLAQWQSLGGWRRLALQQFGWGEVLGCDNRVSTPSAAVAGVPPDLEDDVTSYLERYAERVACYLRDRIRSDEVLIECCPTSNLVIAGVSDYEDHPLWGFLLAQDLKFTVNSDDPLVFGGFAGSEVQALLSTYLSDHEGLKASLGGLEARHRRSVAAAVDEQLTSAALSVQSSVRRP